LTRCNPRPPLTSEFPKCRSSKGPWVLSSSQAVHQALFEVGGLPSPLGDSYCPETNHQSRTRMRGGVGGAPGQPGPLSRSWLGSMCLSERRSMASAASNSIWQSCVEVMHPANKVIVYGC